MRNSAIALSALVLLASGCKEGDVLDPDFLLAEPAFEAEAPEVTEAFVSMQQASVSGTRVIIDVVVNEVGEPISGLAMKLTYPARISQFVECHDGELFPPGSCLSSEPAGGEVFISRSLTAPDAPLPVSGARVIVSLEFLVFGVGVDPLNVEGQNLGGSDASALLDRNGDPIFVRWYSGAVVGE